MSFNSKRLVAPLRLLVLLSVWALFCDVPSALAQTPGYTEQVIQWTVKSSESCEDIAAIVYGDAAHKNLVRRYNNVPCTPGAPLQEGLTLVLPAKVSKLPTARITSVNPETLARPRGGNWATAYSGQPLSRQSAVNTRAAGRAGIEFVDRTRVQLAERTLVVIYGTASESRFSQKRPGVELKSGELQAGLAALRGESLRVDISSGGSVAAQSRDTVINARGQSTNVSVFDGHADVSNAGETVRVPARFGTRFTEKKPPEKPRPLPPAPLWQEGGSAPVVLAFAGKSVIAASWKAVPNAGWYRVEVARDAAFTDLVVRERVPSAITAFRAQDLPPAPYYLRVAAIDVEGFLGIASSTRNVEILQADWEQGSGVLSNNVLEVNRYSILGLGPSKTLRASIDGSAFALIPSKIDFRRLSPAKIRFKDLAQRVVVFGVDYEEVQPQITLVREADALRVNVVFGELAALDVAKAIAPRARVIKDGQRFEVPLSLEAPGRFTGMQTVPNSSASVQVFIRDGFGRTLASGEFKDQAATHSAPRRVVLPFRFGSALGPSTASPRMNVRLTEPWAKEQVLAGASATFGPGQDAVQGTVYASGAIGRVGIDAAVLSPRSNSGPSDSSAWFGANFAAHRSTAFEFGPTLRLSVPLDDVAPPPRLELLLALGGAVSNWRWLINIGGRLRLSDPEAFEAFVDQGQGVLLVGGSYRPMPWARLNANIDTQLLFNKGSAPLARGGVTLGAEVGERVFVGVDGRFSPWDDVNQVNFSGQVAVGFRELFQ